MKFYIDIGVISHCSHGPQIWYFFSYGWYYYVLLKCILMEIVYQRETVVLLGCVAALMSEVLSLFMVQSYTLMNYYDSFLNKSYILGIA